MVSRNNLCFPFHYQPETMLGYVTFDTTNDRIPPALGQTKKPGWWFDVPTPRPSPTNPPRTVG